MLRSLYRDWARAPISGTAAAICMAASAYWYSADRGLLYLILAGIIILGRGKYDASEE